MFSIIFRAENHEGQRYGVKILDEEPESVMVRKIRKLRCGSYYSQLCQQAVMCRVLRAPEEILTTCGDLVQCLTLNPDREIRG